MTLNKKRGRNMASQCKGYVDTTYLVSVQKLLINFKLVIYEQMRIQPGHKVIDVGCGPGSDTIPLAQWVGRSGQVIGVDYDSDMIAEAEKRALKAGVNAWVIHKKADAISLPFESDYFDACHSERLLQHLHDPVKALAEMVRVTKSDGWIVAFDSDWGSLSIDTGEIETERRYVRFFTEQMANNGYSGRQLYRQFKQQGLVDVFAQMYGIPFTDYAFARYIMTMDRFEREAMASGVITDQDLDRLHTCWEQADAEGDFFASVSMILVSGRKP
jgi:ubiquinone/menaquinone biosynthesis C-methylase UbiE